MRYDVLVVGGGHAGCEAALAAARMGRQTALVTLSKRAIAAMPCNPAIGGPGKAQLVRELDALGGEMALTADKSALQTKVLNTGKGRAVWALRVQCDKDSYRKAMQDTLEGQSGLSILEDAVVDISAEGKRVVGIRTESGSEHLASSVIVTTGVYMDSRIIAGEESMEAGPAGERRSVGLADALRRAGLKLARFKTGTSPRLDRRSIDFSKLKPQWGQDPPVAFSFMTDRIDRPHLPCWLTRTNPHTHEIIRKNLHRAPLFTGEIQGTGPRYCPSIEDKIVKFPDRGSHQVFLEPEGLFADDMYVLGMSTSLPKEVQKDVIRTIPGFEETVISKPGYAIEYECLDPTQLAHSMEVLGLSGLFAAGQVNGTSGYEEAAVQGFVAGVNAALACDGRERFTLDRSEAFIGVLIDDLVSKGTAEPYRMLTSRSEYRLLLRQDNADIRLSAKGLDLGLVTRDRFARVQDKERFLGEVFSLLSTKRVQPTEVEDMLRGRNSSPLREASLLQVLLERPEIRMEDLVELGVGLEEYPSGVLSEAEIETKYAGYIERQKTEVARFRRMEGRSIPDDLGYSEITGLSMEARQKLEARKPRSVGEALKVSGVSLSDVGLILNALTGRQR